MRLLYTLLFVISFLSTSVGQSFTLPELIKMSKMDVDNFDTYVTSKGFVFMKGENDIYVQGGTYRFATWNLLSSSWFWV